MGQVPGEGGVADRAEIAVTLAGAASLGGDFPASVPDTPANRALFEEIKASIAAMPEGVVVELPSEFPEAN